MNLSHLWDSIFFSIDPAKFSSSLPLSLSLSFHHAMKKKKEEGKLLKREEKSWKRKGGKRERKSNKPSLLSSPTTLSPSTIPSTPNLPPSSGYSSFLSFLFLLDHPRSSSSSHLHAHAQPPPSPQFPIVYSWARTQRKRQTRLDCSSAHPPPSSDYIETTSVQNRYCAGTPTLPDDLLQNSTNLRIPKLFRLSCFPLSLSRYRDTQGLKNNFRDVTELHHHRKDFPFFFYCATYPIAFCLCDIEFDRVSIAHYVSEGVG